MTTNDATDTANGVPDLTQVSVADLFEGELAPSLRRAYESVVHQLENGVPASAFQS